MVESKTKNTENDDFKSLTFHLIISIEKFQKLQKISTDKEMTIDELLQDDIEKLIDYYQHQYESVGLKL